MVRELRQQRPEEDTRTKRTRPAHGFASAPSPAQAMGEWAKLRTTAQEPQPKLNATADEQEDDGQRKEECAQVLALRLAHCVASSLVKQAFAAAAAAA